MSKTSGFLLFYMGIVFIILSAISVYMVFSGKMPPLKTFNLPPTVIDAQTLAFLGYKNTLPEGQIEILPATVNNQFANFFAHLIIMGFFGGVGYKLSMLGAYILRPINIQVKETIKEVSAY